MVCTTLVYAFTLWTAVSAPVGALLPTSSTYGMQSVRVLDSLARSRQNGLLSKILGVHNSLAVARSLKQQTAGAEATVVATPQEFIDAVEKGDLHIEVQAHLDLTTIQPQFSSTMLFLTTKGLGQTIRGNCQDSTTAADLDLTGVAPLDTLNPGQCVILTDINLMTPKQEMWLHNLYIRRHSTIRSDDNGSIIQCVSDDCKMWLTEVTLQGDGNQDPFFGGLAVSGGQLYGDGVSFLDFSNKQSALYMVDGATATLHRCNFARNTQEYDIGAPITLSESNTPPKDSPDQDAVLRLQQCTFSDNSASHNISATSFERHAAAIYSDVEHPVLIFSDKTSEGATLPLEDAPTERPGIDATSAWLVNVQEVLGVTLPPPLTPEAAAAAVEVSEAPAEPQVEEAGSSESPEATPRVATPVTESAVQPDVASNDTSGGSNNTAAIVGGVAAVIVGCIVAAVAVLMYIRYRRRSRAGKNFQEGAHMPYGGPEQPKSGVHNEYGSKSSPAQLRYHHQLVQGPATAFNPEQTDRTLTSSAQQASGLSITSASHASTITSNTASQHAGRQHTGSRGKVSTVSALDETPDVSSVNDHVFTHRSGGQMKAPGPISTDTKGGENTQMDTFDMPYTSLVTSILKPPGPQAGADEKVDFLQQQLDSFDHNSPIFDDLVLLGSGDQERRQGGQAIVQMAMSKTTRLEYAIKFFLSAAGFNEERGLYRQGSGITGGNFAQFLPKVLHVLSNEDGKLKDGHGHPLPPCIVMERGESLDLWAARRHPDRSQAFSMMHQLASRLKELHALGYVHRDLKPGNVMWLPRENRWTIIDFGCVAPTGTAARLGFSLAYAAPEVIAAYRRGDRTMVAEEAVDVWSLGVMAFEMLTGSPAISMLEGKEKAMDRIQGLNGLQLPWEGTLTPAVRRQLRVFRGTVLKLLARDPAERPSMQEFCTSCDRVLGGSTSVQI